MKKFPTLFKYTSSGKVQEWTIYADKGTFWTVEGLVDGKLTTSTPTICKGKNPGKSNETSPEEQAEKEAQSRFQHKIDKGYNEVLTTEKSFFEPMLAHKFKDHEDLCFTVPTFIQPKLDGLRCINDSGSMISRGGKPFVTVDHVSQDICMLDGELYSHDYKDNFNKILSLCRKTKPTDADIQECSKAIEFWAYDFPGHDGVFSERYEALKSAIKKINNLMIKLVPTYQVFSFEDIEKYHIQFINDGYEGSIIRLDTKPYQSGRSSQLLKKKDFDDSEFEIVEFLEGLGGRANTVGKVVCRLKDGTTFEAGMSFNAQQVKEFWKHKDSYVGKTATIRYFGFTPGGKPRFGVCKQIARETYE